MGLKIFPFLVDVAFSFGGATHPDAIMIRIMEIQQATWTVISFIIQ